MSDSSTWRCFPTLMSNSSCALFRVLGLFISRERAEVSVITVESKPPI